MKILIVVIAIFMSGCLEDSFDSQSSSTESSQWNNPPDPNNILLASSSASLPGCEDEHLGRLVYTRDNHGLYLCTNGRWKTISLVGVESEDRNIASEESAQVGEKGPTGDKGETGEQGPVGNKGARGDKGLTGDKGASGDKGLKGDKGASGDKGPTGDKGPVGDQGIVGVQGPQGEQGLQGEAGERGPTGFAGPIGPSGGRLVVKDSSGAILAYTVGYESWYDASTRETRPGVRVINSSGENFVVDIYTGVIWSIKSPVYFTGADCTGEAYIQRYHGKNTILRTVGPDGGFHVKVRDEVSSITYNSSYNPPDPGDYDQEAQLGGCSNQSSPTSQTDLLSVQKVPAPQDFSSLAPVLVEIED